MLRNIRFYVILSSIALSLVLSVWVKLSIPAGSLQIIRLTQIYALTALSYLYFTLLAGPLCFICRWLPFRGKYLKARRALGVSTFYFGLLHAALAFFGQLGGFAGLGFLSPTYLVAISLSFSALVIFALMAATSFDAMVTKLTYPVWKFLHRFVYIAAVCVLIHALMLGTHFSNLSTSIPTIFFVAFAFLLLLEAHRFDAWIQKRMMNYPRFGLSVVSAVAALGIYTYAVFLPGGATPALGIHTQHIQMAKDAQTTQNTLPAITSLQGDRTKRYTVSFSHPETVAAGHDVSLSFTVFDASSGNRVTLFNRLYEKFLHLIVVDSSLTYFSHIHPDMGSAKGFVITTQFPHDGVYHLYLNFQPLGAIEQQFGFTVTVGDGESPKLSSAPPDTNLTKIFGAYEVTLRAPSPLLASQLAIGGQPLTFVLKDTQTKQPITTLKPYLAAFGHLVMINQATFEYIHVHPTNLVPPAPDANGGPNVEFLPLGLYGPIKPGVYRVFGQFNPNGSLMVADFTIAIE